jgi:hypothetical protein
MTICLVCGKDPCEGIFFSNEQLHLFRNSCRDGVVKCPQCLSEGYINPRIPCPRCLEEGPPRSADICPVCKNSGTVNPGYKQCALCAGTGEITIEASKRYKELNTTSK